MNMKRLPAAMAPATALASIIGLGLSSCSPASEQNASEPNAVEENAAAPVATEQTAGSQNDVAAQNAKARLKAMSDYLAAQKAISLGYDTVFEVVTDEHQKLQIATSGTMLLNRPDKIRAVRKTGFSDTE